MFQRGWFQLVVRDVRASEKVRSVLSLYTTARLAQVEAGEWPALGHPERFAGVIAEQAPGVEAWIRALRRQAPGLPVLVLTPLLDGALFGRFNAENVEVAMLPLHVPQLVTFVQRALANDFLPHERVGRMLAFLADRHSLTPREVQLVSYCLGDESRARVRRRLGISENTLKTQIKALLRKCGERNVDALAKNLLRAALLCDRPQRRAEPVARWLPGA
ncbi:MAG TPA: LuxR C-terminal-related transcriptional regulator, partial [Polyangiales bacterium]